MIGAPVHRPRLYLACSVAGIAVFAVSARIVDGNRSPEVEQAVFHAINSCPGFLYWPLWAVMQLGNLIALPAAAGVAALTRRWRLAAGLLAATVCKLYAAKLIKSSVDRDRPAAVIDDVIRRGDVSASGQAFVSGHAIVAFALATLVSPYLSRRWMVVAWGLAVMVCLGRVYVGAHLPLDVVGGAAIGWSLGCIGNFILGVPARKADPIASLA